MGTPGFLPYQLFLQLFSEGAGLKYLEPPWGTQFTVKVEDIFCQVGLLQKARPTADRGHICGSGCEDVPLAILQL